MEVPAAVFAMNATRVPSGETAGEDSPRSRPGNDAANMAGPRLDADPFCSPRGRSHSVRAATVIRAAAAHAMTSLRRHRRLTGLDAATAAELELAVSPTACNANAKSRADWNLLAGSFSSA